MTDKSPELDLDRMRQGGEGVGDFYEDAMSAIDLASDQGTITWVVYGGKRICAIVPVDVAEHYLGCMGEVLEHAGRLHEHDGFAPHSHEVRPDHLGVSQVTCPECGVNPCKMDCSQR